MYKVPIYVLQDIVNKLENSNRVLPASINNDNCDVVTRPMTENLKQIDLLKINYHIENDNNSVGAKLI